MWRKNPVPRPSWEWPLSGPSFEPVCEESEACKAAADPKVKQSPAMCRCSGTSTRPALRQNLEIVDRVRVPDVKPGAYVLQWRWDSEETDQVHALLTLTRRPVLSFPSRNQPTCPITADDKCVV
eukprot:SAG31_NODE_5491_length_2504_cov_1.442412_2_plen_124_part_00